jgi:arylsulfatase A-like enzyme
LSPRDDGARAWETLSEKQKLIMDYRMAVIAAQVHRMDWNIWPSLVQTLHEVNKFDNTLYSVLI